MNETAAFDSLFQVRVTLVDTSLFQTTCLFELHPILPCPDAINWILDSVSSNKCLIFITVLLKWLINSILWHFKINADISILDKSVILGLPFCVFTGYSVLTYANDSLISWLPDRIKTIN